MKHVFLVVCLALLAVCGTTAKSVITNSTAATCTIPNGEELQQGNEKMTVGERTCTIFSCKVAGLHTLNVECVSPQCVNAVRKRGACCYSCPNGYNCRLPGTGEVIGYDSGYRNGTHYCSCPSIRGFGWDQDLLTAQCVPITTTQAPMTTSTAVPKCSLSLKGGEETLNVGESKVLHQDGECKKYVCEEKGVLKAYFGKCKKVNCDNPVVQPGHCCPSCAKDPESSGEPESYYLNATVIKVVSLPELINTIFSQLTSGFGLSVSFGYDPSPGSSHQNTQDQTDTGKDVSDSGSHDNDTKSEVKSSSSWSWGSGTGSHHQHSGGCKTKASSSVSSSSSSSSSGGSNWWWTGG